MIARWRLLELGFGAGAIRHTIEAGRLHPIHRGVYVVGRPEVSVYGRWTAAVLACGPNAVLSHESAAALWGIRRGETDKIDISLSAAIFRRPPGIGVHRRSSLREDDFARHCGIPVTSPACTLVDLAARLPNDQLEAAVNAADKNDLIDPERLRVSLRALPRRPGLAILRRTLDRNTYTLTDSELERRFLALVRNAGLPLPLTQQ